ncbi:ATP-binding protein [bacterium]|nr:ATP-binding protein [bacterium]
MELGFAALEELRRFVAEILKGQSGSLRRYFNPDIHGFQHTGGENKTSPSIASTGTCVVALLATGRWNDKEAPWHDDAPELAAAILSKEWTSAALAANNVFSVAWVLETITALENAGIDLRLDGKAKQRISQAEEILVASLEDGSAAIEDYPASAYVTQLAVRVLVRRQKLENADRVREWALTQITMQIALILSKSSALDVYTLAYATILFAALSEPAKVSPQEKRIVDTAIEQLFASQLPDGSWPRSRPLFHYPRAGNAYCFEYEMLVQLLETSALQENLLRHMHSLRDAAYALTRSAFQLDDDLNRGWASGHHPNLKGPESWSTASVFHFLYSLDRLIAEAVRRATFTYLDRVYTQPSRPKPTFADFAPLLWDSEVTFPDAHTESLKKTLFERFVEPIARGATEVELGRPLPKGTKMSAILFGPPGTSKTQLAKHISEFLGWPLLEVDPSHLVREGMDRIQKEANALFSMIEAAERVVVFLDEFDEMVRDRSVAGSEAESRFLTTAMLPKLSRINDRRRVVFLLATNYIDNFDFAISRPGRFDVILQVMPPTTSEKMANHKDVADKLRGLGINLGTGIHDKLAELTFGEFERLAADIRLASDQQAAIAAIELAHAQCTLQRHLGGSSPPAGDETWAERSKAQHRYVRS